MLRLYSALIAVLLAVSPVHGHMLIGGSDCSTASHEVGNRAQGVADALPGAGYAEANMGTADCTGPLNTAYLHQYEGPKTGQGKICIYNRTDATPVVGDTLVGCSSAIAMGADAAWRSGSISGNVTASANYWVVVFWDGTGTLSLSQDNDANHRYYKACSGCFDSPPANLDGTWGDGGAFFESIYATIGD